MGIKKWKSSCQNLEKNVENLMRKYNLPHPVALYFVARDIKESVISDFLNPRLAGFSDPYRFPGIKDAAKRLWDAIFNKEPILIHGDYDTDGITASALLSLVLRGNGAIVHSFIPHRFDDGYGFTPESLIKALSASGPCKVLVTVDCGITSCDAVEQAVNLGIDTIITDHHEAGSEIPNALAVINPKIYPELEDLQLLSGAGVAFKLSHAFVKYGRENNLGGFNTHLEDVLDYVALGTVADIVPLLGENRIMVKYGIEILKKQFRPGVRALIESSRLRGELVPSDITFKLAPRINAAGRVGDANIALSLLESDNIVEAYKHASTLEDYNRIRQEKEQEIYQEAKQQIELSGQAENKYALLVAGCNWHQGVIGIVASRLARDYNRPTIVLTIQGDQAYGSGRSIGALNLVEVLGKINQMDGPHRLTRFGGHPMAVGIGLEASQIESFHEAFDHFVRQELQPEDLEEFLAYDGETELAEVLDLTFYDYLAKLAPFGHSNPKPIFRFNELQVLKCFPAGPRHTRGMMMDSRQNEIEFIAFNQTPEEFRNRVLDVLAVPQLNNYYNLNRPQLNIIATRDSY